MKQEDIVLTKYEIITPSGMVYAKVWREGGMLRIAPIQYYPNIQINIDEKVIPQLVEILLKMWTPDMPGLPFFANIIAAAEREACLKEIAIELDEWSYGSNANIALNSVDAAIRARSEK